MFIQCTRGFDTEKELYLLNIEKLKEKLLEFNLSNFKEFDELNHEKIKISFIHKNFNGNFVINDNWIEFFKNNNNIDQIKLNNDDKFLKNYLKIFSKTDKFRKKIKDVQVRAFYKTVKVYKSDKIIDIIFVVKILK